MGFPTFITALLIALLPTAAAAPAASPFSVSDKTYPGADGAPDVIVKVLTNSKTGESAEILQSWGGKVERVKVCKRTASGACAGPVRDVIASRCESERCAPPHLAFLRAGTD